MIQLAARDKTIRDDKVQCLWDSMSRFLLMQAKRSEEEIPMFAASEKLVKKLRDNVWEKSPILKIKKLKFV